MGFNSVIVSAGVPCSCMLCSMCCAYADCGSLFFMYLRCSRHLTVRSRLVCPMYALLQVLHVILYTPLLFKSGVVLGFGALLYCVCCFVGYPDVCVFE